MPGASLEGLSILVVEDVAAIRSLVVKLLERLGCADVLEAADSETAWQHLERTAFDAVLLDYGLQGDDGISIALRLRLQEDQVNTDVPIILLTAHDEMRIVQAARQADIDAYLVKPVMPDRLGQRIIEAIRTRQVRLGTPKRSTEVPWRD
jgi:two-component system, chemotaxis family, chemotaxis protein CheY